MGEVKTEAKVKISLADQLAEQAKKLGISVDELKKLAVGKKCPKYGTSEILHARKNRAGAIMVFNISDRLRGEKISTGRKLLKAKRSASVAPETKS